MQGAAFLVVWVGVKAVFSRLRHGFARRFVCRIPWAEQVRKRPGNESPRKNFFGDYVNLGRFRPPWPGWGFHSTLPPHSLAICVKGRTACPNSQTFGILLHIFQICRHLSECGSGGDHYALIAAKVPPCTAGTETYRSGGAGSTNVRDSHKRADVGRGFSHRLFLLSFLLLPQAGWGRWGLKPKVPIGKATFQIFK